MKVERRIHQDKSPLSDIKSMLRDCVLNDSFLKASYLFEHCRNVSNPENCMIAAIDISKRFSRSLTFGLVVQSEMCPRLSDAVFLLAQTSEEKACSRTSRVDISWMYKRAALRRCTFEQMNTEWGVSYGPSVFEKDPESELQRQISLLQRRWKESINILMKIRSRVNQNFGVK